MIDFATLQGLEIAEGEVTEITDAAGRVLWAVSGGKVILQVEKITSDTYAAETTYTGEQFILLDIYPKTNGTVKVTYGGLTKTITDTSGAAEPNAQQVFFGTFNGVSDSVTTPASGELTIEGDYVAFSIGYYAQNSKSTGGSGCYCITAIKNLGAVEYIPDKAFGRDGAYTGCNDISEVKIPASVKSIGTGAFYNCRIDWGDDTLGIQGLVNVIFANPSGWYVTETKGATSGITVDVTDPANNAILLTETYLTYYWYRAEAS